MPLFVYYGRYSNRRSYYEGEREDIVAYLKATQGGHFTDSNVSPVKPRKLTHEAAVAAQKKDLRSRRQDLKTMIAESEKRSSELSQQLVALDEGILITPKKKTRKKTTTRRLVESGIGGPTNQ